MIDYYVIKLLMLQIILAIVWVVFSIPIWNYISISFIIFAVWYIDGYVIYGSSA